MTAVDNNDDKRFLYTDQRVKEIVKKMRDSQLLVESVDQKRFGIKPAHFDISDIRNSYSQMNNVIMPDTDHLEIAQIIGRDGEVESTETQSDEQSKTEFDILDFIIIRDDSTFTVIWRIINALACVISSYLYAYLACFGFDDVEFDEHDNYHAKFLRNADMIFFIIFSLTIVINCLTEYHPLGETQACRDIKKIV